VALAPDEDTPEWWAGAPSVAVGPDGVFHLAARMREGRSPKGRRGYEVRILRSDDGIHFTVVNHLTREQAGVAGFERPSLLFNTDTGKFRLYGCANLEGGWGILLWDEVEDPARFDGATAKVVLRGNIDPTDLARVSGFKDPVVFRDKGDWHLFAIGTDFTERIHRFTSDDGVAWRRRPGTVLENSGWHNFYTRPASIVPLPVGYLFVYEGSHFEWHDPVYNVATGLAYSPDLDHFIDLTPDAPLLTSTTPGDYQTWRYSCWLLKDERIYVYFEAARPNRTNELRVAVLDAGVL
jgi:hypothetical protein